MNEEELEQALKELEDELYDNMEDIEPEFSRLVDENFWELIE